jgi:hypothetical protein
MKRVLKDAAWLTALIVVGFASIVIDARVGFPAMLALIIGRPM